MIDHEYMKRQPQIEIVVIHHESDGLYTKEMHIPAGVAMGKEIHNYSHQSFLGKGRAVLIRDDKEELIDGPVILEIKAGVWHTVVAVTDVVWYCTHNTDRATK